MQIVINDLLVHYEVSGKGKLVVLLHGWGDSAKGLTDLRNRLAEKYQVLALDLPGFGATQPPDDVWDLDDYADFTSATLQKINLGNTYAVIGHSNGGALAIRAFSLNKLEAEKLVLIAASGIRSGASIKRLLLKVVAKVGNIATIWMPERYRRALRQSLYGAAGSDMLVVPHLQETFKRTVRQDVQQDAAKITTPTLLIYADNDQAVPVADGQTYHRLIKNSQLEVITDAGHFVHLDQAPKVIKLIEEFLV